MTGKRLYLLPGESSGDTSDGRESRTPGLIPTTVSGSRRDLSRQDLRTSGMSGVGRDRGTTSGQRVPV